MAFKTPEQVAREKLARALRPDGFNEDFEELVIDKIAETLRNGRVSKETILATLDVLRNI